MARMSIFPGLDLSSTCIYDLFRDR
jgi:hypothetical protein